MTIYYTALDLTPSDDDPRRLLLRAAPDCPLVPDEVVSLRTAYTELARVAAVLFEDDLASRKAVFLHLHQAAHRAFVGEHSNLEDGRTNLVEVREIIVDYAHKVRDQVFRAYGLLLLWFGLIPLVVGAALHFGPELGLFSNAGGGSENIVNLLIALSWITAGAAMGVWIEFGLRMQAGLEFDQLLRMDPSRWRPRQRLAITIGTAFVFAFLLASNAIQIGVGNLLLNDFLRKSLWLSLAVGGVTGLAFPAVMAIVFQMRPSPRQERVSDPDA